jgi:hypothetical protein
MLYKSVCESLASAILEAPAGSREEAQFLLSFFIRAGVKKREFAATFGEVPRRMWESSAALAAKPAWEPVEKEAEHRGRPAVQERVESAWRDKAYHTYDGALMLRGGSYAQHVEAVCLEADVSQTTAYKYCGCVSVGRRYTDLCVYCETRRGLLIGCLADEALDVYSSNREIESRWERHVANGNPVPPQIALYNVHRQLVESQQAAFDACWGSASEESVCVVVDWSRVSVKDFRGDAMDFYGPKQIGIFGALFTNGARKSLRYILGEDCSAHYGHHGAHALMETIPEVDWLAPTADLHIWADSSRRNFHNQYFIAGLHKLSTGARNVTISYFGTNHGKTILDSLFAASKKHADGVFGTKEECLRTLATDIAEGHTTVDASAAWEKDPPKQRYTVGIQNVTHSHCFQLRGRPATLFDYKMSGRASDEYNYFRAYQPDAIVVEDAPVLADKRSRSPAGDESASESKQFKRKMEALAQILE